MRTLRGLLMTAVALVGLYPSTADAQQGRRFEDAWFWGVKGGGMLYSTARLGQTETGDLVLSAPGNRHAPVVGLEWLITRSKGGLYVSYDQSFLDERAGFINLSDPDSAVIAMDVSNTRRVNLAGMIFPPVNRYVQPYVGLGLAYMQVASTHTLNGEVAFNEPGEAEAFEAFVVENKSQFQPLGILGVQARLRPFSVFFQGSATPFRDDFLLRGGRSSVVTYELGIRYNIGTSIERL